MAKTVLVMGGTRFVGLHAVKYLLRLGYRVIAVNRGTRSGVLPNCVEQIKCDRKDTVALKRLITELLSRDAFQAVIDPSAYLPEDVAPLVDVMEGRIESYVFISTGSVYGPCRLFPWYEDMPRVTGPETGSYGYNKMLCEDILLSAYSRSGFPAKIIRPGYIYGPHNTVYREAYFFDRIMDRRPILVPGTGTVLSQFGHVDDLANLIVLCMESPKASGQAYNFSGMYMRTLDDYVRACGAAVLGDSCAGQVEIIHYDPDDLGMSDQEVAKIFPYRWRVNTVRDISKARYELGYSESISLDDGLKECFRWYREKIQAGERPFPPPSYSEEDRILECIR